MKCISCKYEWKYKGKHLFTICPHCRKVNKVEEVELVVSNTSNTTEGRVEDIAELV